MTNIHKEIAKSLKYSIGCHEEALNKLKGQLIEIQYKCPHSEVNLEWGWGKYYVRVHCPDCDVRHTFGYVGK